MHNEREVAVFESWEVVSSIACQSVSPVFNSKFELFIENAAQCSFFALFIRSFGYFVDFDGVTSLLSRTFWFVRSGLRDFVRISSTPVSYKRIAPV